MADTTFIDQQTRIQADWLNDVNDLTYNIGGTGSGQGASRFGVQDAGGYWTGANGEAVLQEAGAKLRDVVGIETSSDFATVAAANQTRRIELPATSLTATAVQLAAGQVVGKGNRVSVLTAGSTTCVVKLGYSNSPTQWSWKLISDVEINGNAKASNGIEFGDASADPQIAGRWEGYRLVVKNCAKGIYKPYGNIGNNWYALQLSSNDYGYYAQDASGIGKTMHPGNDLFIGGEFSYNALAAYYVNGLVGGAGGTKFVNTIFEQNPGFGVYVKNWETSYTPLVFDGAWFENNATSASVTIDGVVHTPPVDMYLEGARHVVLTNGIVPKVQLVNSHLTVSNSFLSGDKTTWSLDADSSAFCHNVHIDGGAHPVIVDTIVSTRRTLGNFAARFRCRPRSPKVRAGGTVLQAISYASANVYPFTGTAAINATTVADGVIYDSCAELSIPAGNTELQPLVTFTSGNFYLLTFDIKPVSGTFASLNISFTAGGSAWAGLHQVVAPSGWTSVAAIGEAASTFTGRLSLVNSSAGAIAVRLSALQVVEFATERDLLEYFHAGAYSPSTTIPRTIYSTVAPTTGTWAVGDRCINTVRAVAQPKAWGCTVAGTPGTWVSEGNL